MLKAIKAYVDAQVDTEDTISELNDTTIGSLSAGELLIFNSTSGKWVNAIPTGSDTTTIDMTVTGGDGTLAISADLKNPDGLTVITDDGAGSTLTATGTDEMMVWDASESAWRVITLANLSDFAIQNGSGGVSAFKTISVSGQDDIVADVTADTLTLGGTSIAITSTAASDTLAFNVNIDGLTALGGTGLHQTQDHFMFSDNGTEKKITFSNLEDAIFANVSGDATIAAGGALTIAATSVENSMLAGSIANSKLANDSVSFGGVSLDLGQTDATPAFDLTDATNYPTSSLTGTITNAQLAGSIANAKLANSSITVSDGSNSTATALGGTITFAGTSNETTVAESSGTVTIGLPDDVTIASDLTLSDGKTEITQSDGSAHGLKVYRNDDSTSTPLVYFHDDHAFNDSPVLHVKSDRTDQYGYAGIFEGKVGIGITAPDELLHVSGAAAGDSVSLKVTNTDDTDNASIASLHLESQRGADSNFYIEHNAYGQTKFYTGNSKNHALTLEENGSTTVEAALTGDSTASFTGSLTMNYAGSDLYADIIGPSNRNLRFVLQDNGDTDSFLFRNAAGTDIMTLARTGDLTVGNNLTVGGDLVVSGTTTTINTATVEVEDNILQLNTTQASPDTATAATSGISVYRGDGVTQASLIFDDGDDTWDLTNHLTVAGTITGNVTGDVTGEIFGPSANNRITVSESNNRITFRTNGGDRLVIYNNGVSSFTGALNVDNINLNGNTISSTDTNGDITVTPNGTGDIVLDGQKWPQADGSAGQILKTDGNGQLSYVAASTIGGDGLTLANGADNRIVTATGSAALNGESALTFDGTTMNIRTASDHPLVIENTTNAGYAGIQFSDASNSSYGQKGELRFNHSDSLSDGAGASFHFTSTEALNVIMPRLSVQHTLPSNNATTLSGAEVFKVDSIDDQSTSGGPGFQIRLEATNDHNAANYERVFIGDGGGMRVKNKFGNWGFSEWWLGGNADGHKPIMSLAAGGSTGAGAAQDGILTLYSTTSAWANNTYSPTNNTAKVVLDAGGDSYFTGGNVGIGDTSPAEKLQVAGNIRVNNDGIIRADGTGYLQLGNTNGGDIRVFGDGSSSRIQAHGNHLYLQTNRDADDIIFAVNKGGTDSDSTVVEAMRIVGSDGNVGIGTTSPGSTLHLTSGSGYLKFDTSGSTGSIKSDFNLDLYADDTAGNSSGYQNIRFFPAGAEKMRIAHDGKVGIGTTSPETLLHVDNGTIQIGLQADDFYTQLGNNALMFHREQGHLTLTNKQTMATYDSGMNAANDDLLMLDGSTMRVGIGTTSPGALLHVSGDNNGGDFLLLESSESNASLDAPDLVMQRNINSPGANTQLGTIKWRGKNNNASPENVTYAEIQGEVESGADGSENGRLKFGIIDDGTFTQVMTIDGQSNVKIPTDTGKLYLGASDDLSIYHDGSNSYIDEEGTGSLIINSSQVAIKGGADAAENMATFVDNGAVTLYHNNAAKFATSADGVTVTGTLSATSKSFVIPHPTKEKKTLRHGSLEGPEHGVYIRGRLEGDTIELPDYWLGLVDEDTITVQLTPNKGFQQIYVDHIEDNKVYVGTQTDTPIDCFYFIQAERKDVDKMEVEYDVVV